MSETRPAPATTPVMDHTMIGQFVDMATDIMEQLSHFAAIDDPEDDDAAEVRRLRVMATAMLAACDVVSRMSMQMRPSTMAAPMPFTPPTPPPDLPAPPPASPPPPGPVQRPQQPPQRPVVQPRR